MKIPRPLQLAFVLTLLALAGRAQATTCIQNCINIYNECVAACDGNTTCDTTCIHQRLHCEADC